MAQSKPHLLVWVTPIYGHIFPLRAIASHLIKRNYEVIFLTESEYESATSSTFIPLGGSADTVEAWIRNAVKDMGSGTPDFWTRKLFIEPIPRQWEGVKRALENIRQHRGDEKRIVVLVEGAFRGCVPGMLGAQYPGPAVKGWIEV